MSEISKLKQSFSIKKIDSETSNIQVFDNDILMGFKVLMQQFWLSVEIQRLSC